MISRKLIGASLILFTLSTPGAKATAEPEIVSSATTIEIDSTYDWTFDPAGPEGPRRVRPGIALVDQLPSSILCCSGHYRVHLPLPKSLRQRALTETFAVYIPVIGGTPVVRVSGVRVPLAVRGYSSVGPIVPLRLDQVTGDSLELEIEIESTSTNLSGIWKGLPVIGPFQGMMAARDSDRLFQQVIPILDALILALFAAMFLLIHHSLRGRSSNYLVFAWVLASWALFYFFLSGLPRDWNFFWGTSLHYPVRIIASFGLFAMVASHVNFGFPRIKRFGIAFLTLAALNLVLGLSGFPIHQKGILVLIGAFSFYPLLAFRWKDASRLRRVAFGFSLVALLGQTGDALKLMEGVLEIAYPFPFLNRYTFLPILLLSIGDCVVQFSGAYHELRVHLFRAKQHAKNALKLSTSDISEDTLGALLRNPRRLTRVHRASILKRNTDGNYRVIEVDGVAREAIGNIIAPSSQRHIAQSVHDGSIVVTDLARIRDSKWKTTRCAAVPIPQVSNPPYLLLLSDPRSRELLTTEDVPYLSQFSSALWANLERTRELQGRMEAERRFATLVKVMDPNLFEFVTRNIDAVSSGQVNVSTERGIIFFDQKSYSTMMEDLDDQDTAKFALEINDWVTGVAARYGAMVTNFAGDAYLIEVFSLIDETPEKIGLRTLDLVWALAESLSLLNQRLLSQGFDAITFRFGAHFGSVAGVALDFIRPGLRNIVGDNVNIASRLQSIAPPGRILISENLASFVRGQFALRSVPRSYVKGRQRIVEIHEVIGKVEQSREPAA
jgi:class 3 adenylate cyclase